MRRALVVAIAVGFAVGAPRAAVARRGVRLLFEPTDLELEEPGVIELDLQAGLVRGQQPWRLVIPDFELDVGVWRNFEIDIDGAYALEASRPDSLRFDSTAPDNFWICGKVGIFDWADEGSSPEALDVWAIGAQAGPKIPIVSGSHGLGVEGLVLIGHVVGRSHFALNLGGFVDPHPTIDGTRPIGLEAGLDFDRDLDGRGRFQGTAQLSGVRFLSTDPNQLLATVGFGFSPTPDTQLTLTGLWGFLDGNDRYGGMVGVSQKFHAFERH